jgi:hypothetical protein
LSNLRIDIASEFDNRGFAKAQLATNHLDKAVTKLGKKLTAAFSAYKIAQFGKDSVKAFAADQKAAAVLAQTLDNVNQGYQTDMVNAYIAKTEALYGVLDDKLRPAFSQLVIATGDATKSQALLQTALDVSAGTGKDLESVTAALSKAYLGNTTALQRLGVGLSKADLAGKSFNQIVTILNQNFAGQAATAADTYGGKIDRLNVAFENMKETIGKGIIDSLNQLNTSQGFNGVIEKMGTLAQDISDIILGIGVIAGKLQSLPGMGVLGDIIKFNIDHGLLGILKTLGAKERTKGAQPSVVTNFLSDMKNIAAATAKANTNAKTLLKTTKDLTKEQKDQLALKKAGLEVDKALGIFNLDKIELAAAAMSKQTAEDYARIKLKQDILALQDAINKGDAVAATQLASVVEEDYKRVQAYQAINIAAGIQAGIINNIKNAASLIPTNIDLINLDNLKSALDYIKLMLEQLSKVPTPSTPKSTIPPSAFPNGVPFNPNIPYVAPPGAEGKHFLQNPATGPTDIFGLPFDPNAVMNYGAGNPNLKQQVTVTIIDNTSGIIDMVTDATQQASANGINTRLIRNTGGLSW